MSTSIRVVMAQLNLLVGDIPGNAERIIATALRARDELNADLVLFPELALSGYPPEDLLLRPSLEQRVQDALQRILASVRGVTLVLGYPCHRQGVLYNMAGVIRDGEIVHEYAKQCLPNFQVFDEMRYFAVGQGGGVFEHRGARVGLAICEDIWNEGPVAQLRAAGAELVLILNASPFHIGKPAQRRELLHRRARQLDAPLVYLNLTGGQDELVFDGGSMLVSAQGEILFQGEHCQEALYSCTFEPATARLQPEQASVSEPSHDALLYRVLVQGVRDYVDKNGFRGVVLGLSGGIDSALTAAVAVDALGADRVEAVMMPFRYTSSISLEDAQAQARALGIQYDVISIEPIYDSFMQQLAPQFQGLEPDTTEENLQARCRGVLLMALSNKKGYLVLTTGNKSEMAVGYSTLYGDMAGGFDLLKDVAKTRVYRLARYRNTLSAVIPPRVIERPPSAELAPGQTDQDSLPDYAVLDRILELYIERDYSAAAIIAAGFSAEEVNRVVQLVDRNEYKRRQAPIGPRVTQRGFGRDRRYPITSGWKAGV
jgi:NAD+ synthase (glutamine-hydrolysing)